MRDNVSKEASKQASMHACVDRRRTAGHLGEEVPQHAVVDRVEVARVEGGEGEAAVEGVGEEELPCVVPHGRQPLALSCVCMYA